jgi:gas vesicle protein
MANGKKWALGAVVAGIGGYVAGILTAPKSGKETRQDIKEEATKLRTEAEKRLKELHTELDEVLGQAKEKVGDVKSAATTAVTTAEAAKNKVREILSSIHSGEATNKDLDAAVKEAHKALDNLKKYVKTEAKK